MAKLVYFAVAIAVIAGTFAAGATTAIRRGWGVGVAMVEVSNVSGRKLTRLEIQYETCGNQGSIQLNLTERFIRVPIALCGEGGYTLVAQLEGGRTMRSNGAYIETGYVANEAISENAIHSEVSVL